MAGAREEEEGKEEGVEAKEEAEVVVVGEAFKIKEPKK